MTKPKTKPRKKKKKIKPELMDLINNLIKSLKDPRDKAKIQSLIKGNKPKDVLFEMKQILRNFNPYHRQGSSYVVSSVALPVKKPRSKKMKPEPSWYIPEAYQNTPISQAQSMVTPARANIYDANVSALNQEVLKNLSQMKQEFTHLSTHLHDQNVSALKQNEEIRKFLHPPPIELDDKNFSPFNQNIPPRTSGVNPMDPVPLPSKEELERMMGGIFSSPSSVFYHADAPETKSASSSSSSSAKPRTSSRFMEPPSSFTRSHDQLTSPPAHNTRSRAKP